MGDYHLKMEFDVAAKPTEVRRWLDNTAGIAGWWSDKVEGSAGTAGDKFRVHFPTTTVVFQLEVEESNEERIEWHIPESPPWWRGTTIRFDLTNRDDGGTQLLFSHRDFDPDNPVIPAITPAWAQFLLNLKNVAETGQANPAVVN